MTEPIKMLFGVQTHWDPRHHVLRMQPGLGPLFIYCTVLNILGCAAILVVTSHRIFNNFRAEMDRTEPDRFGPTRCGPVYILSVPISLLARPGSPTRMGTLESLGDYT